MDILSTAVLVPFGFFAFILGLIYLNNRKKIHLAMIANGIDPNSSTPKTNNSATKFGIFLAAVGIGVLFANAITALGWLTEDVAFLSMILIFGGAALIGGGFIDRTKQA